MEMQIEQIAEQLKASNKKVQLIYAFNGTGKTRLSKEFKNLIARKNFDENEQVELARTKILYYNAFTEDLFYWDNDLEGDAKPVLKIQPNTFTDWVLKDQGQDKNIISNFQKYTTDKLTPHFNSKYILRDDVGKEKIIKANSEVTFSFERGNEDNSDVIKISKGEESLFIWSIFYCLLDQVIDVLKVAEPEERETEQFNKLEYIFIDDPVSSLDENHLIQLAVDLASLIKKSASNLKFIITTHSPLFYNVLHNEINSKSCFLLTKNEDNSFELQEKQGDSNSSFSYHLHIKKLIEQAIRDNNIQKYHFILLRNLYEKTASFLGYQKWSKLLPDDKDNVQSSYELRIMNFYSHKTLSNEERSEPTEPEKKMVSLLLNHLIDNYGFFKQNKA